MYSSRSLPVANTRCVMSEWRNWWMLRLPETIDWGVDTACGCNCHCLCLWCLSVACIRSGFVMNVRASGLRMVVGMFSRPLRGVGVLAVPDAGLDTMRCIGSVCEVPLGAGVLQLLVPGVAAGVFIDRCCVADGEQAMRWVISAMQELFSEDEGVECWPWIDEATELPPWEESLLPAGMETRLLAGGCREFPEGPRFCRFWCSARVRTFHTTGVVSGWGLWEGIVRYRCSTLRMPEQFPLHAYAKAGKVDPYYSDLGGIRQKKDAQCRPR